MDLPNVVELACVRCGMTTTHQRAADGAMRCVRCRVIIEQAATIASDQRVAAAATRGSAGRTLAFVAMLAMTAGFTGGFFHCVHGGDVGFTVARKEEWGFYDQVVSLDDIIGMPLITQMARAKTIRALMAAGILARPEGLGD